MEENLITLSEAASILGYKDVSGVSHLVRRGRLRSVERYGKTLVFREDVENFQPAKRGPKPKASKQAGKKKAGKK